MVLQKHGKELLLSCAVLLMQSHPFATPCKHVFAHCCIVRHDASAVNSAYYSHSRSSIEVLIKSTYSLMNCVRAKVRAKVLWGHHLGDGHDSHNISVNIT
jgi:hypothetical protein